MRQWREEGESAKHSSGRFLKGAFPTVCPNIWRVFASTMLTKKEPCWKFNRLWPCVCLLTRQRELYQQLTSTLTQKIAKEQVRLALELFCFLSAG